MAPAILWLVLLVGGLAALALLARARAVTTIYPSQVGLLYRDGRFERELPPGRHVRLDPFGRQKIVLVSLTALPVHLGETTVLSKDQFSFRLGLAPILAVVDPRAYSESQGLEDHHFPGMMHNVNHPALPTVVSAAAVEAAGTFTLAEILADRAALTAMIRERLAGAIPGAEIGQLLLTSINLPPETRKMFTEVERARMEGLAALERARSEQAALRVLANAARMVNDNPGLANLRLLQAVESSRGSTTILVGHPAAPLPGLGTDGRPAPAAG
jgi:regulator of protease activity HflC (stomatin/prohibitin superfamily)